MRLRIVGLVCCFVFLFTLAGYSQVSITGAISGTVKDPTGAPIPGATVTATSTALMTPRVATTSSDGAYLISNLPVGTYTVSVAAKGFKTSVQNNVELQAGFNAPVSPTLQVGEATQSVEVSGAAPIIDVKSETVATTFGTALLQNLPSGRDPWSTLEEEPGVTTGVIDVGGNQTFYQTGMNIHGSVGQTIYSYDGLNLSWPGGSGTATSFYNDNDALAELQTVTDAAPADVSIGGVYMNFISQSGSNQVHGNASVYYETAGMESATKFPVFNNCTAAGTAGTTCTGPAPVPTGQPIIMMRDTEGGLGGPIIKDRWWIYGAWRLLDTSEAQDQLSCTPGVAGQSCPLGYEPAPSYPNHQSNITLRNDFQINDKNRVFVSWWWNEQNQFKRISLTYTQPEAAQLQIEPAYNLIGGWDYAITPNLVLNTRLGYQHLIFPLTYEPGVTATSVAYEDTVAGALENAALTSQVEPATEWRGSQEASYFLGNFMGSHNIKFGWVDSTNRNGIDAMVNENVRGIFNSNNPTYIQVVDGPTAEYSLFHEGGAFAEDAWTVGQRLTLSIGGRWDHWDGWIPSQSSPAVATGPGGISLASGFNTAASASCPNGQCTFPGFTNRSESKIPVEDWNNFSPRLGFAYDLTGHGTSVVKASFDQYVIAEGTGLAESINPNVLSGYQYAWLVPSGSGCTYATYTACNAYLAPQYWGAQNSVLGAITTHLDPNMKRPFSNQITAGYEQELFKDLRLGVTYYWRNNRDNIGRYNLYLPPSAYTPVSTINPINGQPLTVYAATGGTCPVPKSGSCAGQSYYWVTNAGAADDNAYNGVEITATKHMSHNWQLLGGLTIQRYRGNYTAGTGDDFNDPNLNINRSNAYLSMDSTYVFKLAGSYQTGGWAEHILVSETYQYYTGYPERPTASFGTSQGSACSSTRTYPCNPFEVGGVSLGQSETIALLAPGVVRLPNISLLDLRFARPVRLKERYTLEPTLDLFNITNSQTVTGESVAVPQPSSSTPNPPTTTYLKPSSILNPFIARVGLKLTF